MKGKRWLSILVGIIEGLILGIWIFVFSAYIPAYWKYDSELLFVPEYARDILIINAFFYGALPGIIIGFIGGAVTPFLIPRGHLAKSIGATSWLIATPLAYITYWDNFILLSAGTKALAGAITFVSLMLIIPVSGLIGEFLEKLRE